MFAFDERFVLLDVTPVENQFILNYLPSAQGDHVRVYLYGLMQCRHPAEDMSIQRMAHELNLTPEEVMTAFRHWEFHGLVQRISDNPPVFRYLSANERGLLGAEEHTDSAFLDFAEALAACFGEDRRLHGSENSLAYEWVEVQGLHPDVVIAMVRHLIHTRGRHFSFATTGQKMANRLSAEHVRTVEEALAVLSTDEKVIKGARALLRRIGQKRRDPTDDELALCRKWLTDWGFTQEAIEEACGQMTATANPNFAYLDGILSRLHSGGARTGEAVRGTLQAEQENAQPLRALLGILRVAGAGVNQGTLNVYSRMRELYPDEVIQLAGRVVSAESGDLSSVQGLLEEWHRAGLSPQEIQARLEALPAQDELLRSLYRIWGAKGRPGDRDRLMAQRWTQDWGFSPDTIRYAAEHYASGKGSPVSYLHRVLEQSHQKGLLTPEQMAQAHSSKQTQQARQTRQQQYTQRTYEDEDPSELPDWLKTRMEGQHDPE